MIQKVLFAKYFKDSSVNSAVYKNKRKKYVKINIYISYFFSFFLLLFTSNEFILSCPNLLKKVLEFLYSCISFILFLWDFVTTLRSYFLLSTIIKQESKNYLKKIRLKIN